MLYTTTCGSASRRGICVPPNCAERVREKSQGQGSAVSDFAPPLAGSVASAKTAVSVNLHVTKHCNGRCVFCYARFPGVKGQLSAHGWFRVIDILTESGVEKVNFAGGEPTIYPDIGRLIDYSKQSGLVTGIVTNGFRLRELLEGHSASLDWVGISVDSASEATQKSLGRGNGDHIGRSIELASLCRQCGIRVKLNTVVTAKNCHEDMSEVVRSIAPCRWKVFQVLKVQGQNQGLVDPLLISNDQFRSYVERHQPLASDGYLPVAEDNHAMIDSYVMVDPEGRFFGNTNGVHCVSQPILDIGVDRALAETGFDPAKFESRGGRWTW